MKNISIFETRLTNNFLDAVTGTNIQREPTGASPAVIFKHRLFVGRRDSLLFIYSNHLQMRPTNDNCANCTQEVSLADQKTLTAEQIIETIQTAGDLPKMRRHLREMTDAFLLSDEDIQSRQAVHCTYLELDNILKLALMYQPEERRAS